MFVAHLPAGYILTRRLIDGAPKVGVSRRCLLALGLLSAILPDFDLLYFYLIDHRQTLHHLYWTHLPLFWLGPAVASFIFCAWAGNRRFTLAAIVFYANIFLHLLLDTVVGNIFWLYPFLAESFSLFEVPPRHAWWVWNYILHWSFGLELLFCAWALTVYSRAAGKRPVTGPLVD